MGLLSVLFGEGAKAAGEAVAEPIKAVGGVLDTLFTSDEERLTRAEAMERLRQMPAERYNNLLMADANSSSWFQKNWRPSIGWVCGMSLAMFYWPQFSMASILWVRASWNAGVIAPYPVTEIAGLMELTGLMLGFGALRTYEKRQGLA